MRIQGTLSEVLYVTVRDLDHLRSIGELSSTLGASSLKNFSAVCGCHSFSKAVFFISLSFLGLICSLHRLTPPSDNINVLGKSHSFAYSYESHDIL